MPAMAWVAIWKRRWSTWANEEIGSVVAEVKIVLMGPHRVEVKQRQARIASDEYEWKPLCSCGWIGPSYPNNDRGSAEQAADSHYNNSRWTEPFHSVKLVGFDR